MTRSFGQIVRRPRTIIAVLLALALALLTRLGSGTSTAAADVAVGINNFAFTPPTITVSPGTRVVWTNMQIGVPHTVTSDTPGVFDSGSALYPTGATFAFTFNQPGTFAYHCSVHPNMHGTVIVTAGTPPPEPTSLNPSSTTAGGDPFDLVVLGAYFQSGATVYRNSSPRTTTFVDATQLVARITAADIAAPGTASIVAINPDGQSSTSLGFTITVPPPQPQSVSQGAGPAAGGTAVTIIGKYFQSGATVTFGGAPATGVTVISATQISAVTPAYFRGGLVDVVVKNPDGMTGTLAAGFMYVIRPGPGLPGAQPSSEPGVRLVPADPGAKPGPMPGRR